MQSNYFSAQSQNVNNVIHIVQISQQLKQRTNQGNNLI